MKGTTRIGMIAACLMALSARASDKPPRAVIEYTYISSPQRVGDYALTKTVNYSDEGNVMAGVGFRYRDPMLPAMTTDIYVYPAGESESIEHAEKNFRATVAMAAQAGAYSDVVWGESVSFQLARPDASAWAGQAINMHMREKDHDVASRTYLFHQGLYDYKVRLDVPAALATELPPAADALVRAVLPRISVVSVGSCGKKETATVLDDGAPMPSGYIDGVSPDGFRIAFQKAELRRPAPAGSPGKAVLDSLVERRTALARQHQIASGCTSSPYQPDGRNMGVLTLHFPADFWATGPAHPRR